MALHDLDDDNLEQLVARGHEAEDILEGRRRERNHRENARTPLTAAFLTGVIGAEYRADRLERIDIYYHGVPLKRLLDLAPIPPWAMSDIDTVNRILRKWDEIIASGAFDDDD